jgi:hypothetical protein
MANIAASDVTYSVKNLRRLGNSKVHNVIQLDFGDGALTYPAGGIPLTPANMGCPNAIESLVIVDKGLSGYNFGHVQSSGKLAMFRTGAINTPEAEPSTVAVAAQSIIVEVIGW